MLSIQNLHASVEDKEILKGIRETICQAIKFILNIQLINLGLVLRILSKFQINLINAL